MEYTMFNFGFGIMSMLFPVMFLLVFGIILVNLFRGLKEWNSNNHSPRLTVEAEIVSKRTNIYRKSRSNHHGSRTSTTYFATFQFESGDRLELQMQGHEYGLLIEGDKGRLTFQGTRYLGFERLI